MLPPLLCLGGAGEAPGCLGVPPPYPDLGVAEGPGVVKGVMKGVLAVGVYGADLEKPGV